MFRKYLNSCKGISYDLMEETFAFSIFWSIGVFGSLLLRNIGHINTQEGGANHQYMKGTGTCVAYLTRSYSRIPTKPFVLWIHSQLKFCNAKVSFIPANMMESDLIQIDIRLFLDTTFLSNLTENFKCSSPWFQPKSLSILRYGQSHRPPISRRAIVENLLRFYTLFNQHDFITNGIKIENE